MNIKAWQWNYFSGEENDVYGIFINDRIYSCNWLMDKLDVSEDDFYTLAKQNNSIFKYNNSTTKYIAFYDLNDAKKFADWLESIYMINKLII